MNHSEEYPYVTPNAADSALSVYLAQQRAFWRDVHQSPLYQAVPVLVKVWTPCLLLLGGFGNVATIFVLRRTKNSNSSQHVFLIALAVADLSFLYSKVLLYFIQFYFSVKVVDLNTATCKLFRWLPGVSSALSGWLVTAVTVQRTLAVTWPHKVRMMCTVRRTWTVVAALVITGSAFWSDTLAMSRVGDYGCGYRLTASYMFFLVHISTWLFLFVCTLLPFACLLVCDVILSLSLFQAASASSVAIQTISNDPSVHRDNSRMETARKTTVMILTLSISFLILTLPDLIFVIWANYSSIQLYRNPKLYTHYYLMEHVSMLILSTNSAINFVFYCFTGTRFRREFLSWICCSVTDHSSRSVGK